MAQLFASLLHYPVLDRHGRVVTSAITSLDIHDLARSAATYGVTAVYIVHPAVDQRNFARTVIDHWIAGQGRVLDERRQQALKLVEVVADLDEAIESVMTRTGDSPMLVMTSARAKGNISYSELRAQIAEKHGRPLMLLFGTAFGLAPAVAERCELTLPALKGPGEYNHLSVRAAAAAILDRLRGR